MSDLKMSDVFDIPLFPVDYQNGIKDRKGNIIMSGDEHEWEKEAMCQAINQHDALTAKVEEQQAEIERLRGMLNEVSNKSIACANELALYIDKVNEGLEKCIIATDTQPPDYHDHQTAHEAGYSATKALEYLSECAK